MYYTCSCPTYRTTVRTQPIEIQPTTLTNIQSIKMNQFSSHRLAQHFTRMHGVSAHTGFPRMLTKTIYISAIFSMLNPILSVANLSRLECAETPCIRVDLVLRKLRNLIIFLL